MATGEIILLGVGDVGPIHEPMSTYSELAKATLASADIRFGQCERVYSERGALQLHSGGAHSRVKPAFASVFSDCGFDVVSVASNHSMDWGPEPILDTIELLEKKGIKTVGAGRNLAESRRPAIIEKNGVRVAFLAYSSILHEGYAAGPNKAGVAPLRAHTYYEAFDYQAGIPPRVVTVPFEDDLAGMVSDIQAARQNADAVVVSLHWGIHFIPKLIADYQPVAAKAAFAAGADLILGHHAHTPKAIAVHGGKTCFYSLSNFIMSSTEKSAEAGAVFERKYNVRLDPDYPRLPYGEDAKRSLIAKAVIGKSGVKQTAFLPVLIDKQLRPQVLKRDDARFDDAVRFMDNVSQGFEHKFVVEGGQVNIQ
ncbi:MAG: CapA family protein [Betaproteobacteria bacterium]|nr:CapA family protein [Betaproteobacteria bacterium]